MNELITTQALAPMLDELRVAYRARITDESLPLTVRTWVDGLAGLSREAVHAAIRYHIRFEKNFPRVSEIRAKALEATARGNAMIDERGHHRDADRCHICGARAELRGEKGRFEIIHDRKAHGVDNA